MGHFQIVTYFRSKSTKKIKYNFTNVFLPKFKTFQRSGMGKANQGSVSSECES